MGAPRTIGWKLNDADRRRLLKQFPPAYDEVVADHVTLQHRAPASVPLPKVQRAQVVGRADDGRGVQALVVAIDGATDRPDGSVYHMTWSLGPGRRAVESNDVLASRVWEAVAPLPIGLTPAEF